MCHRSQGSLEGDNFTRDILLISNHGLSYDVLSTAPASSFGVLGSGLQHPDPGMYFVMQEELHGCVSAHKSRADRRNASVS